MIRIWNTAHIELKITPGMKAVSYTHLDVYKRQVKLSAEARNEGTVTSVSDGIVRIHGLADVMQGEMIELPNSCLLYTSRCV